MAITQEEFNFLVTLEKEFKTNDPISLDSIWSREILSVQSRDIFLLDYYKSSFRLEKYTYNKRYRKNIVLIRYDSVGKHTNPDQTVLNGPHVHLYTEGYDDRVAFPPEKVGIDAKRLERAAILRVLLKYFNVRGCPVIQLVMF